jgi:peptidoglycan/LPS O-acetylase OafA/YrhL
VADPTAELARRTNNFDALRIAAALCVIVGHAWALTGRPVAAPPFAELSLQYLGVSIFFVISGYLITGSWERSRSVGQYVSSRVLRIMPLLLLVVLLSTFVLGPAVTSLPLGEYFRSEETWRYLINILFLPADGLPGVFDTVPYAGVVNGSVWTLRAEVICYGVVLVLGLLPRRAQICGFAAFGAIAAAVVLFGPVVISGASVSAAGGTWVYFAVAALVRLLVPRSAIRLPIAVAAVAVWVLASLLVPALSLPLAWIVIPYFVLAFGLSSTPVLRRAARFGDLSYGLYLWAFPVQQLVVLVFGLLPVLVNLLVVVALTAALAFASWHLLEKRALKARFRLPWFRADGAAARAASA